MTSGEPVSGAHSPEELYKRQLEQLKRTQALEESAEKRLGYMKIAIAFATIAAALLLLYYSKFLLLLLLPAAVFVFLSVKHEIGLQQIRERRRSINFYERGIARLQDRWAGTGETGERFLEPTHPYARDLDLFGQASLFELLCTARTRAGEETLARWLLNAAPISEIGARHGAIADLKDRLNVREQLFCIGETVRVGVHPEALAAWGEREPLLGGRTIRIISTVLAVLWVGGVIAWGVWGLGAVALALSALNFAWAHRIHTRWDEAADSIEGATRDLDVLAGVLRLIDHGQYSAAKLTEIQSRLKHSTFVPSDAIRRLDRIVGYLESRRNPAMRLLDVLTFWSAQCVFQAERWQQEFGPHIRTWLEAVGEFEALTALAGYSFEHPTDVMPKFVEGGPLFEAEEMTHPLLPVEKAVRNNVKFGGGLQLIVLSSPNMAGKSTFIRSVGVNAVLAQCGAPVRAKSLTMSPLVVAASICVLDSLSGGTSRFYAEIQRLKVAEDLAAGDVPVLFLMDELLSGTNSHDRLEGTRLIVRSLMERGAIGIVSTHDLALAEIPNTMPGRAVNYHFEDRLEVDRLVFDYKLKPGVVKTSNALQLMRSIGLGIASGSR